MKNHQYKPRADNKCEICARPFVDHSSLATCEACSNKGDCELIGTPREFPIYAKDSDGNDYVAEHGITGVMLLCADCAAREATVSTPVESPTEKNRDRIVELLNKLDKGVPMDGRAYFNSKMMSIVEIEQEVEAELGKGTDASHFKVAEIVLGLQLKLKKSLFEVKQQELDLKWQEVAGQRYLNNLVPKLREEERAKFKDYDISYKPVSAVPTSKPSGPRMSAQDKAIASFAAMMKITVEQARLALSKGIANTVKCTCAETPGLCKAHPKG